MDLIGLLSAGTDVPDGWTYERPADLDTVLQPRLVLKAGKGNDLRDKLFEISTPGSEDYGKHLSQEQLVSLVAPEPENVDLVVSWLIFRDQ